jgi:diguanylate cyclase
MFDLITHGLPTTVALALVALLGYLVGSRARRMAQSSEHSRRELKRAKAVISELETIAQEVRRHLAAHHGSVLRFKDRVKQLTASQHETAWRDLCQEAERVLRPTLDLAAQIAHAYDKIRQQTNLLMTFTEVRTDPLTGLSNRRALDDSLATMFAMLARYDAGFTVALVDIDHFKKINDERGHLEGDRILQDAAQLFDDCARETDIVSRYGGEEFVVVMPHTELEGACVFAERLRKWAKERLPVTISVGVAGALDGDSPRTILARADAALYSAKAAGRNRVYRHTGIDVEPVGEETAAAAESPARQGEAPAEPARS